MPGVVIDATSRPVIGAMREIARQKLRIGTDLSLVACDEISLTELAEPAIAVVERDNLRMGREAGLGRACRLSLSDLVASAHSQPGGAPVAASHAGAGVGV